MVYPSESVAIQEAEEGKRATIRCTGGGNSLGAAMLTEIAVSADL